MASTGKKRIKILEAKYFGLLIGIMILLLTIGVSEYTSIINNMEIKILDVHFRLKNTFLNETIQEGVSFVEHNPDISPDILIVGIDFKTLTKFGKWPFPRYTHSYLINTLSRISNPNERERALFMDIFFVEPDSKAIDDAILIDSIKSSGRVFLETILDEVPPAADTAKELFTRQNVLYDNYGEILNIIGDWESMISFPGIQAPLQPYASATRGYGHANYLKDSDEIYRRQPLIGKFAELIKEIKLDDLNEDFIIEKNNFQRLAWIDKDDISHNIEYPLDYTIIEKLKSEMLVEAPLKTVDNNNDGTPDESYHIVRLYKDNFLPAITLALALEYFNKELSDIEVSLGKYIFIPHPQYFNTETGLWGPYQLTTKEPVYNDEGAIIEEGEYQVLNDIKIPIDENGAMLVNFMGRPSFATAGKRQTFPVRSYSGYASNPPGEDPSKWPKTRALGNKIVMVGAFARGVADDQKPTPFGLMYGVEIHANALNTILMSNFITNVPYIIDILILVLMVMVISFISSRLSTIWAFFITIIVEIALFIVSTMIFDSNALLINFSAPALATFLSLIAIIVYRIMTEEKDKKRIRHMFGTYVNPKVVDQLLENPPELGGLDKEITVLFSDIRGFTRTSEGLSPQDLVKYINKYLTAMTEVIDEDQGTLDKYVGDEIMAFWGAPMEQKDHALRACKSAVRQMEALRNFNKTMPAERQIDIGIGLNSGIMTVANVGSTKRMNYTLMGDNVNLGARLEGTNKVYRTNIIISENTYGLVKDQIIARELDNIRVKGKNKPVLIYELIDFVGNDGKSTEPITVK
ncbi:MAG: adenylate/guanylate cyclase domain-containing protein [Spirochaetia bacterium]|jgi:adenylate cyclase|nr:adenylate/guanylate cyclase domain-containing protein [Spirochaetia bacterium]